MNEKQVEETVLVMQEAAYELVKKDSPYVTFFDGYIELLKENIAMASEEDFKMLRQKRDIVLGVFSEVSAYAKAFENKLEEEQTEEKKDGAKKAGY